MAAQGGQWMPGWTVMVTAVHSREKDAVVAAVERAGGQVCSSASVRDPPHVVITRSVRSPRYRALLRAAPDTPAVTPEWLAASAEAGRRLPYDEFRVRAFHGLTICLSGLAADKKAVLASLVARGGGIHSPALDKKCTHLVASTTDSDKYKFAVREGIPVVRTQWVIDSVELGWCQDEAPYLLRDEPLPNAASALQHGEHALHAYLDDATTLTSLAPAASAGQAFTSVACPPSSATACVPPSVAAGGNEAAQSAAAAAGRGGSRLQRANSVAAAPAQQQAAPPSEPTTIEAHQAAAAAAAAERQRRQAELDAQLDCDDDAPPFLDSVRLRLLGCGAGEQLEALGMVRLSGAKRFADPRDDLSHLVFGTELSAAEAGEALDFLSTHRSCVPVTLDWLRQCVADARRLPPDGFLMPTSRLTQHRRKPPALEQVEAAGRLERSVSSSVLAEGSSGAAAAAGAGGAGAGAAAGMASGGELGRSGSMPAVSGGALEGCYFTLAALRGKEGEAEARRIVQDNGGRLFTETTLQRVTDKGKAFALCPHSLVPQEVTQLRSSCPDFKLVDEAQRFTVFWLRCCLVAGKPIPPNRGAPLHQPLPYPLPLPSMQDVVVSTSGYDEAVKTAIHQTVTTLGGKVTPENMSPHNTHLILPVATGRKFEMCREWGVTPVTADWLIDTVQLGRRQAEENYRPLLPAGMPPLPSGAPTSRFAAEAAAGGCGPVTQVATTQLGGSTQAARRPPPVQQQPAAAAEPPRPQLVLPPPPAQQQQGGQQPGSAGGAGRRKSLRERMKASQAVAAAVASRAGPASESVLSGAPSASVQQQQTQPLNDENAGQDSNSQPQAFADLLQLGAGKPPLAPPAGGGGGPQQQAQQQQLAQQVQQAPGRQRSALDEAMASLDEGLRGQQVQKPAAQQAQQQQRAAMGPPPPQQQQMQQQQAQVPAGPGSGPSSLFDSLFGEDPPAPAPAPPARASGRRGAVEGPAEAAAVADERSGGSSGSGSGGKPAAVTPKGGSAQKGGGRQGAGRSSGKGTRTSSRLRPAGGSSRQQPGAGGEGDAAQTAAAAAAVAAAAAAATGVAATAVAGSEPQEDVAHAIEKLSNRLLVNLRAEAVPRCAASQLDMPAPPPPARARAAGAKRGAPQPAESSLSNGSMSGGSMRSRATKRPTLTAEDGTGPASGGSSGRQLRRSGRGRSEAPVAPPHLDMSQQVGYADSLSLLGDSHPRHTRGSAAGAAGADRQQELKRALLERAERAAKGGAKTRRGSAAADAAAARSADPLAELMM